MTERAALETVRARLRKRYRAERRFRRVGATAIGVALAALFLLLGSVLVRGTPAFLEHRLRLEVALDEAALDPDGTRDLAALGGANYAGVLKAALQEAVGGVSGRSERRALGELLSAGAAYDLRERVLAEPSLIGTTISFEALLSDDVDLSLRGEARRDVPESDRQLNDRQLEWLDSLAERGLVRRAFAARLLSSGDSREPELAGVWGAAVGSFWTLSITLALSFPLGVAAAIYLEELAPRSRFTDLIEVNINNLAAVPSIVFGLLGLAFFLNVLELPRSAPLVGGMVLALLTLPTIIIASRAALRAVPPSIREAALAVGASQLQTVFQHVVPLALPGMLTGAIIGMARALGETAPLLMIGMVAFIVDVPSGPLEPATALPVQIFLWADSPERAFVARTSAAILVLLGFLVLMNSTAVLLRNRFERRW
jgi:phosphate transport system permease protein